MKGARVIFTDLFSQPVKQEPTEGEKQRPRNVLMPDRNKLLMYRYYWHIEINRMRFDDVLKQLEKEFFIVEARLVTVLTENEAQTQLKEIIAQKPERFTLELAYPHINWKYNPR